MSWKSWRRRRDPTQNNSLTRAQQGLKMVQGEDSDSAATDTDAARSEAATNQNQNRTRQGGSAQIDYYGTETETT